MTKIPPMILSIFLLPCFLLAAPNDTTKKAETPSVKTKVDTTTKKDSTGLSKVKQTTTPVAVADANSKPTVDCGCIPNPRQFNSFKEWLLVFSPFLLFTIVWVLSFILVADLF